jgi:acyl-CoA thioesterase FadM
MANQSFSRRYVLPAWLHVGSEISFRKSLHLGDTVEIRTVPVEKWKRKGHEFVDLYLSYLVDGAVAVEIKHTSIYKIAAT